MTINILISTMNEGINSINKNILNINKNINIIICHQITKYINPINPINKQVKIIEMKEKGLSKSRNSFLLNNLSGICILSDDDVLYEDDLKVNIQKAYKKYPDADIITFQAKTPEDGYFKNYSSIPFEHTQRTVAKVSSIEVTFKAKSIRDSKILFDERFGLGSTYKTGEEYIFLSDCLKKGLKVVYYPLPISIHPIESSGKVFSEEMFIAKGAVFYRVFSNLSYIISFLFAVKKHPLYKEKLSFTKACKSILIGINQIKKDSNG